MEMTPNYKPLDAPETPYQNAKKIHDSRLGLAIKRASKYELVTILLCVLLAMSVASIVYMSGRSTVKPYVVQVMVDDDGNVLSVSDMDEKHITTEREQKYFVGRFIEDIRTISSDKMIVKDNWLRAYDCVTQKGNGILSSYAKLNDPFAYVGKITVTPKIHIINKITENSYQAEWTEKVFNYSGKSGEKHYSGVFTIKVIPPKEGDFMSNPLGVYIDEMQWGEKG
jgi:type IV secretion system protein VirB5